MDRLDSWLNGQVGWRRIALIWLVVCPMAVVLGSSTWALNSLRHLGCQQLAGDRFIRECELRLGTGFLVVAALSVLAALPLAWLLAAWQVWWAARKPGRTSFSWCRIASAWCLSAALLLTTFADQQPYGRRTYYFVAQWVLIAGAVVFWLVDTRHQQLTRRARAARPNGQCASSSYENRDLPPPP